MKQTEPDQLSLEFMRFCSNYIANRGRFEQLINDILNKASDFYQQSPVKFNNKLQNKLYRGSLEHGEPIHELDWIDKEFEQELIDMVGYALLYIWNEKRIKRNLT